MSFVSDNNRLSGYKTCIEALKHPMYTWLRSDSVVIAHLILQLHRLGTRNSRTALIDILSSVFSRSDVGALWSFPPPKACGLRGLGNLEMVLYFGFLFVIFPQEVLSVSSAAQTQDGCRAVPLGRLSGAISLSVSL